MYNIRINIYCYLFSSLVRSGFEKMKECRSTISSSGPVLCVHGVHSKYQVLFNHDAMTNFFSFLI